MSSGIYSHTSGTQGAVKIIPTYNQTSGTAANTDLLVLRTETALGSGAQYLLDLQKGGSLNNFATSSLFNVSNMGLVGIGTSTPNWNLQIASSTKTFLALSDMSASANQKHWFFSSQSGNFYIGTSSDALATSTVSKLTITSAGNVGVGTTTPYGQLSVAGLFAADNLNINSTSATSTLAGGLAIETSGLVYDWQTNNVGIGTISPQSPLHIGNTSYGGISNGLSFGDGDTGFYESADDSLVITAVAGTIKMYPYAVDSARYNMNATAFYGQGNSGMFYMRSAPSESVPAYAFSDDTDTGIFHPAANTWAVSTNATEKIRIDSLGLVGIGTTTPNWLLQAAGTRPFFTLSDTGAAANQKHWFLSSQGGNFYVGTSSDTYATSTVSKLTITSAGNVGIGTTTPYAQLSVAGLLAGDNLNINSTSATSTFSTGGLTVGGSQFVVQQNSGNVGVGSTSPSALLSLLNTSAINGMGIFASTTLQQATGNEVAYQLNYTTNKAAGNDTGLLINMTDTLSPGTSYLLDLQVGGSSKLKIDSAGAITGGTYESTTALFNASGNNLTVRLQNRSFTSFDNAVEMSSGTFSNTSGSSTALSLIPTYNQTSGTAANTDLLVLRTETALGSGAQYLLDLQKGGSLNNFATSSLFNVSNTGKVGIGTSTPNWNLQIASSTKTFLALSDMSASANQKHWFMSSQGGNFYVGTSSDALATSTVSKLTITSAGNVGIGTTTPYAQLSVAGLLAADNLNINSTSATSTFSTGGLTVGGSQFVVQQASGNVGIGTTSPATALDINGTITQTNQKSCSNGLTTDANGSINGCAASDARLKTDIAAENYDALAIIGELKPVSYKWKNFSVKDGFTHSGFIAQDVEAVFPTAITGGGLDENGQIMKAIDPNAIASLLVKGAQELAKEVKQLKLSVNFENNNLKAHGEPDFKLDKIFSLDADGYLVINKIKAEEVKTKALTMDNTDQGGVKTIGNGLIENGATSTIIMNKNIATTSKIFITWRENLNGADFWICSQISKESFSVCLDRAAATSTPFDYWIVGVNENPNDQIPMTNQIPNPNGQILNTPTPGEAASEEPAPEPEQVAPPALETPVSNTPAETAPAEIQPPLPPLSGGSESAPPEAAIDSEKAVPPVEPIVSAEAVPAPEASTAEVAPAN